MPDQVGERDCVAIRLLIVDEHEMFIEGVSRLLERETDIEIIGAASTITGAVTLATALRPTVAMVDFHLPDGRGTEAATSIRAVSRNTRVLIVTGSTDESVLLPAAKAGCSGVLTKDKAVSELIEAIRLLAAGEEYVDPGLLAAVLPCPRSPGLAPLTKREREILDALARGRSSRAIGDELFLSLHTVRNHVQNIITKLQVHSKIEALMVARREGLLDERPRPVGDGQPGG